MTPRADRTPKRRKRGADSLVTLGVEVDGDTVSGVLLADGKVTQTFDGVGRSTSERVGSVVKLAGQPPRVRVSLTQNGTVVAPMTATAAMGSRQTFRAAAHERTKTHPATSAVAGMFDLQHVVAGATAPAVVLATASAGVDELYSALGSVTAQVVSTPVVAEQVEGLALALRDTTAELTLVLGGRLRAARELPAGGIAPLDSALGQGTVVGGTRLGAALRSRSTDHIRVDPDAVAELQRYLRAVVGQAAAAVSEWSLAGLEVPRRVYVHGRGATASDLTSALESVGLGRHNANNLEAALASLEPASRPRMVGAYLAATTYNDRRPAEIYPNPVALKVARAAQAQVRRSRRTRTAVWCALLLAAGIAAPLGTQAVQEQLAARAVSAAVGDAAAALGTTPDSVRTALAQERAGETTVSPELLALVIDAIPGDSHLDGLTASPLSINVRLSAVREPADVLAALEGAGLTVVSSAHQASTQELAVTVSAKEHP